jgi:hypothetical protein
MAQGQIKPRTAMKSGSLRSSFFKCHLSGSKKRVQWKRKIAKIAITLSQSMSYLCVFTINRSTFEAGSVPLHANLNQRPPPQRLPSVESGWAALIKSSLLPATRRSF